MKKSGLGKGLDALFADNAVETSQGAPVTLRLTEIEPNRDQPRKDFDSEALAQLADSIKQHGILQPLVVRPLAGSGGYQLVAGERRWRAARMAGLTEAPVIIKELDDTETFEIALIENLQREDLNPIEEAEGYKILMDTYGFTQDEVAQRVGKSRPAVANALRLLGLPEAVRKNVLSGALSQGHARTLLGADSPADMERLAKETIAKGLTVRALEKMIKRGTSAGAPGGRSPRSPAGKTPGVVADEIERALTERLGRRVRVTEGKNRGVLEVEYYGEEDLKALARQLGGE